MGFHVVSLISQERNFQLDTSGVALIGCSKGLSGSWVVMVGYTTGIEFLYTSYNGATATTQNNNHLRTDGRFQYRIVE